jgi:hypothetical protein
LRRNNSNRDTPSLFPSMVTVIDRNHTIWPISN